MSIMLIGNEIFRENFCNFNEKTSFKIMNNSIHTSAYSDNLISLMDIFSPEKLFSQCNLIQISKHQRKFTQSKW